MREVLTLITEEVTKAFVSCGYEEKYGKVSLSNRPDLCEFPVQRGDGRGEGL